MSHLQFRFNRILLFSAKGLNLKYVLSLGQTCLSVVWDTGSNLRGSGWRDKLPVKGYYRFMEYFSNKRAALSIQGCYHKEPSMDVFDLHLIPPDITLINSDGIFVINYLFVSCPGGIKYPLNVAWDSITLTINCTLWEIGNIFSTTGLLTFVGTDQVQWTVMLFLVINSCFEIRKIYTIYFCLS